MSQKVNLFNEAWVDLLFKDRNQEYGAFQMRKDSSRRHKWGIIASLIFFIAIIFLPILYTEILATRKDRMVEVTTLSNIEIDMKKMEKPKDIIIDKPIPVKSSIKFTPPVIKPDEEVQDDEIIKTQDELIKTDLTISIADVKGNDEVNGKDIAELNNLIVDKDTTSAPPFFVEQMPEFPGGQEALIKFLGTHVKYPEIAVENAVQGRVQIVFVIDTNGAVTNVRVARSVNDALDKEAVRVVKSMPRWIPGKQAGQAVRVSYTVPVNFVLN